MANSFRLPPPSLYSIVLATFLLVAPVVLALPPLSSEQHRRAPGLTTMAAFSPLVITAYTLLAVLTSYVVLRLFRFFKARFLSSTQAPLPQPVSAGRTSSFSPYSLFASLHSRTKSLNAATSTTKSMSTWGRWHPLSYIYRRLARPSSPLHLSGAELLPTTAPDSPSLNPHSLIELPPMSGSSVPLSKGWSQKSKQVPQPSRSSSMEILPSYRPLTPVPVLFPLPVYTVPAPPSTPPPPTPTFTLGMSSSDIPLVPITPPKRQYMPTNTMSSGGLPTPPLANTFPAVSLSPFKPGDVTASPSNHVAGSHPNSSSPQLFLSSRTLSSLSLSPRSLYMQQQKRSKSLGGVAVKKISQPHFGMDEYSQSEQTQDVVDSVEDDMNEQSHTLIMPVLEKVKGTKETTGKPPLVPPTVSQPKFLLNFSSSSSSSTSDSSLSSDLLSASPLNSNAGSTPASAPLDTPRTASYSSDIAKPSECEPLLPRPIPLVDVDMNVVGGTTPSVYSYDKAAGWSFDVEEQENVGLYVDRVLVDFDSPVATSLPLHTKARFVDLKSTAEEKGDKLIEIEDVSRGVETEYMPKGEWGWDNDLEAQGSWDVDPKNEATTTSYPGWDLEDEEELPQSPSPRAATPLKELDTGADEEMEVEHPDPDLLPLPETIDISLPIMINSAEPPTISVCTQDVVLCRKASVCDSDVTSAFSTGRRTPISPGQIPTPPASPPREPRAAPLPKVNKDSNESSPNKLVVDLPAEEDHVTVDDDIAFQEEIVPLLPAAVEDKSSSLSTNGLGAQVPAETIDERKEEDEEKKIRKILDCPLVNSPATMSVVLEDSDEEEQFTFNVEPADEGADGSSDSESQFEVEVVPPSPRDGAVDLEYGSDDGEEGDCHPETLPKLVDEVKDWEGVNDSEGKGEAANQEEAFEHGQGAQLDIEDEDIVVVSGPEVELPLLESKQVGESPAPEETAIFSPVKPPALGPSTSLPGSFPDGILLPKPESETEREPQSLSEGSSQSQLRRRIRTPLEEAIARTRSPLEVALAMQLRPGLGASADPAWMVRFLMVMWGWMFGVVLVPSAET